MYTFCKSLCVINVGSPYGLHGDPMYISYLYDQTWLVGELPHAVVSEMQNVSPTLHTSLVQCYDFTMTTKVSSTVLLSDLCYLLTLMKK